MVHSLEARPLDPIEFAAFGDVIAASGDPDMIINAGRCGRYHDLARLSVDPEGRFGVSVFRSEPVTFPVDIDLLERHPLGSQTFLPMSGAAYLVVVADDDGDRPGRAHAFVVPADHGVNFHRDVWHAVLMPLDQPGTFAVVDRIGPGANLQEFAFDAPIRVTGASGDQRVFAN